MNSHARNIEKSEYDVSNFKGSTGKLSYRDLFNKMPILK